MDNDDYAKAATLFEQAMDVNVKCATTYMFRAQVRATAVYTHFAMPLTLQLRSALHCNTQQQTMVATLVIAAERQHMYCCAGALLHVLLRTKKLLQYFCLSEAAFHSRSSSCFTARCLVRAAPC